LKKGFETTDYCYKTGKTMTGNIGLFLKFMKSPITTLAQKHSDYYLTKRRMSKKCSSLYRSSKKNKFINNLIYSSLE
jgi:hypothetical protein